MIKAILVHRDHASAKNASFMLAVILLLINPGSMYISNSPLHSTYLKKIYEKEKNALEKNFNVRYCGVFTSDHLHLRCKNQKNMTLGLINP